MFIWNNIFFSLGFDVRDHYKDVGGDAAAFSAPVGSYNCFSYFIKICMLVFLFLFFNSLHLSNLSLIFSL